MLWQSQMKRLLSLLPVILVSPLLVTAAPAQAPAPTGTSANAVPYSSLNELNQLLAQLEQTSQTTQVDLAKLRIDHWKADSNSKRQAQSNSESVARNLKSALPEIIAGLRASPESLPATFKLYRNLDALYDVMASLVESAGAFGSKDEFQSLDNDMTAFERSRRSFADRMESLATSKDAELAQLRTQVKNLQAANNAAPPKKVVVDDTEPPKKPAPKKKTTKPAQPTTTTPPPSPPSQ